MNKSNQKGLDKVIEKVNTEIQNMDLKFKTKIDSLETKIDKIIKLMGGDNDRNNFETPVNRI